jgi:ferredoxin
MRVEVDLSRCVSAGNCVLAASEVFDQRDDDGIVILLTARPSEELRDAVGRAVAMCPAQAIRVD